MTAAKRVNSQLDVARVPPRPRALHPSNPIKPRRPPPPHTPSFPRPPRQPGLFPAPATAPTPQARAKRDLQIATQQRSTLAKSTAEADKQLARKGILFDANMAAAEGLDPSRVVPLVALREDAGQRWVLLQPKPPEKIASAYQFYAPTVREEIRAKYPRASPSALGDHMLSKWKLESDKVKAKFQSMADKDAERQEAEMVQFKKTFLAIQQRQARPCCSGGRARGFGMHATAGCSYVGDDVRDGSGAADSGAETPLAGYSRGRTASLPPSLTIAALLSRPASRRIAPHRAASPRIAAFAHACLCRHGRCPNRTCRRN